VISWIDFFGRGEPSTKSHEESDIALCKAVLETLAADRKEIGVIQAGYTPRQNSPAWRNVALLGGLLFSALIVAGLFLRSRAVLSCLPGGIYFLGGITLGSLALLMLQHLTGGAWA